MDYPCVACAREVRPRQHAVACDICEGWQHRTCGTGINARQYKAAVRGNKDIPFVCCRCKRKDKQPIDTLQTEDEKTTFIVAQATDISCKTPERDLPPTVKDLLQELVHLPTPEPVSSVTSPESRGSTAPLPTSATTDRTTSTANRALFTSSSEPVLRHDTDRMNLNTTRVIRTQSPEELEVEDPTISAQYAQGHKDVPKKSTLPFLGLSFNLESDDDSTSKPELDKAFFNYSNVSDLAQLNNEKIEPVTYRVIKQGSLMGKDLLTDSTGYTYVIKSQSCRRTRWRCSVRTKYWTCRATVIQTGTAFTPGDEIHMHFPQIQKSKDAELIVKIRDKVENRRSTFKKSARTVVQETIDETGRLTPLSERKIQTLIRRTNSIRAKHRKQDVYKENEELRASGRTEYAEITASKDELSKLSKKSSQTKNGHPDNSLLKQIQNKKQNKKSPSTQSLVEPITTRITLSASQKRPQTKVLFTSNMVVPRTALPTSQKMPKSTVQSTTNNIMSRTAIPTQEKIPQPTLSSGDSIVKETMPSSNVFQALQPNQPPREKSTNANMIEQKVSTTISGQSQEKKQQQCNTEIQTMRYIGTAPDLQETKINKCEKQNNHVLPASKKRKITDPLTMNERYQQLLKRPRYERTARSMVEDSIRNQGCDPENPPSFINIENLIRCVNRCRQKNLITECERLMSERQGDVHKTLRPPTEIPVEADSDCLQGKEEDRHF